MNQWLARPAVAADAEALAAMGAQPSLPRGGCAGEHGSNGDGDGDGGDEWLLVAQPRHGEVAASVRVRRAIGLAAPRHWYHVGCVVHAAPELRLFHRLNTLLLGNDHTGASELADLACDTTTLTLAEQASALRFVVQAALLLIARERERFAPQLIVELPGLRDAAGQSPFWHGLGRHFYPGDPEQATARFGAEAWRRHVAALLPRHPVMLAFLAPAAQAALAQVRADARSRMEVLAAEGLRYGHHVAIDDAGPVYEGHLDTLPGVLRARRRTLGGAAASGRALKGWLIAAPGERTVWGVRGAAEGPALLLPAAETAALKLGVGERVWSRPLETPAAQL